MGNRRSNDGLGPVKSVWSKLPVKRRFQVSMRIRALLQYLLGTAVNDPANLEERADSSDDREMVPHRCASTELSFVTDTAARDRDAENVASGYLADGEMEPRRKRASRIQRRLKSKAGTVDW